MPAQGVDGLCALRNQHLSGSEQRGAGLLILGFHLDEPHGRSSCRLGDCFRVSSVIFLPFEIRLHILSWNQLHLMTQFPDLTTPIMSRGTSLHSNYARGLFGQKR